MLDLASIKEKTARMAELTLAMWHDTHQAFMEHSIDVLSGVLEEEGRLNDLEKEITSAIAEFGRYCVNKKDKLQASVYADVVGDLELIGDYCKDILERVQIKIEEKLLFSDEAVREYEELYSRTEEAIAEVARVLDTGDPSSLSRVLKNEGHIDRLVDEYRSRHTRRLMDGVCNPLAGNMFLNMLDFTAAVYYHAKKIARSLQKTGAKK